MSTATCLIQASSFVCAVYSVQDRHNLQKYSPCLRKTCVRQVVLDKWFPLSVAGNRSKMEAEGGPRPYANARIKGRDI